MKAAAAITPMQLVEHIALELGVDEQEVTDDATFSDDLGADSLGFIELIMSLEERLGVDIDEADAEACKTVGDLRRYLKVRGLVS